ncbi:MAG: phage antirepressor KilAC domain-containing protein [Clostridium sp.]|nr:phage antirepressor KilAC domain-containing protein [Clostridium sp.]
MNNLMIFENKEVEVFEFEGKVLFNPYHVGECLELEKSSVRNYLSKMTTNQAILLKNSNVLNKDIRKLHNTGEKFLTESGVYKLIFKSDKKEAEKFQDWVTDEVLPQIRKTGGYISTNENMSDEDILSRALQIANSRIEERNKQIKELKPKAEYTDMVLQSNNTFTIRQIANDYGMSAQELNKLLNKFEIQYKQSGQWLLYKPYKNKGYACSETTIISKGVGRVRTSMHTKWTQKGRKFIYDLLKCKGIVPTME